MAEFYNGSIVRCMPNTPALVNQGATGLFANSETSTSQKEASEFVLNAVSKSTFWVDSESLLDIVTGLSGSGPAYFLLLIECLEDAAVKLGLPRDVANGLAVQTCLGAGLMAKESDVDVRELRRRVTSPGGTTEAAVQSAEISGIRKLWDDAVKAAVDKSIQLGK